jgi:hypothetical protein
VAILERYCGAAGFLASLGKSLQVYLENLAASFPNQQSMESSELYTFIQVQSALLGGGAAWAILWQYAGRCLDITSSPLKEL